MTYNSQGKRTSIENLAGQVTTMAWDCCFAYGYNEKSELTNAVAAVDAAYCYSYNFDDIGNRKTSSERGTNSVYTASQLNQYTAVDDFTPTYDADSNVTLVKTATGIWSVTYNGENRPIRWELVSANSNTPNSNTQTLLLMSFDRMGRRVTKNNQCFVYNGYLQVANYHLSSTNYHLFVWDPTEPVATRPLVWQRSALGTQHSTLFYTHDGNKNVSEVVASDGALSAHYEYIPFGAVPVLFDASAKSNPWRFSSEYAEDDSATVYYNYRHYEPMMGRWMSRDPFRLESANLVLFIQNSPLDNNDAIVIEPPKEPGKLNFVQLKKSANSDWELDIQGTPGPYYYKLFDVWKNTRKNEDGRDVVTLYDAPGGFSDKVDFYTAVVEVNRTCRAGKHQIGFPIINCYDRVKVVASVSWSFDPYTSGGYQYSGKTDGFIKRGAMIPTLQQLINKTTWSTELCSTTKVEVQNER